MTEMYVAIVLVAVVISMVYGIKNIDRDDKALAKAGMFVAIVGLVIAYLRSIGYV